MLQHLQLTIHIVSNELHCIISAFIILPNFKRHTNNKQSRCSAAAAAAAALLPQHVAQTLF